MESQNAMKCLNGCGFYGSSNCEGMCSKCFKEKVKKQMSLVQPSVAAHSNGNIEAQLACLSVNEDVKEVPQIQVTTDNVQSSSNADVPTEKRKNKCLVCKKRVGLTGFTCRCGGLFCSSHRYSDTHECTFDYKTSAKDHLRKANPAIVAAKIEKI